MSQLVPSTLLHSQAMAIVKELDQELKSIPTQTPEEIAELIKQFLTQYEDKAGRPLLEYEPVVKGEPPLSSKINRILSRLENDVNILENQADLLKAAAIFLYNFTATEVEKARNQNGRVSNKLKTLQLYANSSDLNVISFGDRFGGANQIDLSFTPVDQRPSLHNPGNLTLGRDTAFSELMREANIKVVSPSNGFLGNNQEIINPSTAVVDPATGDPSYTFEAEINRHADIVAIQDGEPNTWLEYEYNFVYQSDRNIANNFGFTYLNDLEVAQGDIGRSKVDWAKGPPGGVLTLSLDIDLKTVARINNIVYIPYGLRQNNNFPVLVKTVQTSPDGTNWTPVAPQNLYVGTELSIQSASVAANAVIGTAVWTFSDRDVRYIRFLIEQSQPVTSSIGHLFYQTKQRVEDTASQDSEGNIIVETEYTGGDRVEGPIPPLSNPTKYYDVRQSVVNGDLVQRREVFDGKRWAIGVRDISVTEASYVEYSSMVSQPFRVNGIIDRVALEADTFVPEDFDDEELWIKFFVSPDSGQNWYPINRIQDNLTGVPEIVAFNDPIPPEFRDPGVAYVETVDAVKELRVKIELSRPEDKPAATPVVRSYTLKVVKK